MSNSDEKRPPKDAQDYNVMATDNKVAPSDPEHYRTSDRIAHSSPEQTAAYLADMLQELQTMAEKSGHRSLGEMLEFAHREAVWRSRSNDKSRDQDEMR